MPLIRKIYGKTAPDNSGHEAESKLRLGTSDERWLAARALGGRADAVEALAEALSREQDPRVREAILTGLARIGTSQSAAVITTLLHSDDAAMRTGALDTLRLMPNVLEDHLTELLRDADPDVRVLACDLARRLPTAGATRILSDLLEAEPEANVCAAAMDVLAECGGPEALGALDRCALRFASVSFIIFSARIAGDRIRAQALDHGG